MHRIYIRVWTPELLLIEGPKEGTWTLPQTDEVKGIAMSSQAYRYLLRIGLALSIQQLYPVKRKTEYVVFDVYLLFKPKFEFTHCFISDPTPIRDKIILDHPRALFTKKQ